MSFKHTRDYFMSVDDGLYNVGYSRNEGNKGIDIVVKENGVDFQCIEAKYRKNSRIKDSDGIVVYGLKSTPGYVLSKQSDDFGLYKRGETALYRIPAIAYAYLLGKRKR